MLRPNQTYVIPVVAFLFTGVAPAQFDNIGQATDVVEQFDALLLSAPGAPDPEPGDQIAAFFGEQQIGFFAFTSTQADPRAWSMTIFGDNPDTPDKEGPAKNDIVTFRFFDSSTNTVRTDLAPTNAQGEVITVIFEGAFTFQFPLDIPGAPPFPGAPGPSIPFDLVLGVAAPTTGSGTGSTGDSTGSTGASKDVNGDGTVDKKDAALVVRVLVGASRGVSATDAARADVNGDGVVNTRDVIAILSPRDSFPKTP